MIGVRLFHLCSQDGVEAEGRKDFLEKSRFQDIRYVNSRNLKKIVNIRYVNFVDKKIRRLLLFFLMKVGRA